MINFLEHVDWLALWQIIVSIESCGRDRVEEAVFSACLKEVPQNIVDLLSLLPSCTRSSQSQFTRNLYRQNCQLALTPARLYQLRTHIRVACLLNPLTRGEQYLFNKSQRKPQCLFRFSFVVAFLSPLDNGFDNLQYGILVRSSLECLRSLIYCEEKFHVFT